MDVDDGLTAAAVRELAEHAIVLWQSRGQADIATREQAVDLLSTAVSGAERLEDACLVGVCLTYRAMVLVEWLATFGDQVAFTQAGDDLKAALDLVPPWHDAFPMVCATAASYRSSKYAIGGDPTELDEAITLQQRATAALDPADARLANYRNNLSAILRLRYEVHRSEVDLAEAINHGQAAVASASDAQRPLLMSSLVGSLLHRALQHGDLVALDQAVRTARTATEIMPYGYPDRRSVTSQFVNALHLQYRLLGDRASLDEAIPQQRTVVRELPAGHLESATHLIILADLLHLRYRHLLSPTDLDDSIDTARRAATAAGSHRCTGQIAAALSTALRSRSEALLAIGDAAAATRAAAESVEASRSTQPKSPSSTVLAGLGQIVEGNAWIGLFEASADPTARQNAIECWERAAALLPRHDPQRAVAIGNAAGTRISAALDRDSIDGTLDAAIDQLRELLTAEPFSTLVRAQIASNLAAGLSRRYAEGRGEADLNDVLALCTLVFNAEAAPRIQRAHVAALAGEMLMFAGRPGEAAERCADAVSLLSRVARNGADRAGVEHHLVQTRGLASDAAAARIAANDDAATALRVLEMGRGVMWARMLQLRHGTSVLREQHPTIADRLDDIAAYLDMNPVSIQT